MKGKKREREAIKKCRGNVPPNENEIAKMREVICLSREILGYKLVVAFV